MSVAWAIVPPLANTVTSRERNILKFQRSNYPLRIVQSLCECHHGGVSVSSHPRFGAKSIYKFAIFGSQVIYLAAELKIIAPRLISQMPVFGVMLAIFQNLINAFTRRAFKAEFGPFDTHTCTPAVSLL
jgi:hypothetical protein